MKNLISIISIFVVLTAHAQEVRTYKNVETDHLDSAGHLKSKSVKYMAGTVYISPTLIKIDEGKPKQEFYSVVQHISTDKADEGYTTQSYRVLAPGKRYFKVYEVVYLINPKGRITDVCVKKTSKTHISYSLQ